MFNDAVITAQGLELDAKILAGHASAIFTGIKIGDGVYTGTEDLTALTTMRSIKQEFAISSVSVIGNSTVRLRSVVNNTGIENSYYMSELGVFAQDPDKGEILYSIALGIKNKMDYQPSEVELPGASSTIDTLTVISNSKTAAIKMGMGAAASAEELEEVRQGKVDIEGGDISGTVIETLEPIDTKYPVPSSGESTKVFMGKVKKYIEDTKPLDKDITLYVSPTGSDATGDGSSTKSFRTVTYALSQIPKDLGGFTATVNVADGTYNAAVYISGYTGGYLYIRRNGTQELNTSCNIKSIRVDYCSSVSLTGLNFTNTEGASFFANDSQYVNVAYCQSTVNTINDEVSFNFNYVTNGRIVYCKSLNHHSCLKMYRSSVFSHGWSDSVGNYGIVEDGGSNLSKSGLLQPKGLITDESRQNGSVSVNRYGAILGTLQSNVTLYVSTTGSDTIGDGSSANPFRSIQKALDSLPKDLGGYAATINVAEGIYSERVIIQSFNSGVLSIRGSSTNAIIDSSVLESHYIGDSSAKIILAKITLKATGANTNAQPVMLISNSSYVHIYNNIIDGTNAIDKRSAFYLQGVIARFNSTVFNNCRDCVYSLQNITSDTVPSTVSMRGCTGSGNLRVLNLKKTTVHMEDNSRPSASSPDLISEGALVVKPTGAIIGTFKYEVTLTASGWTGSSAPYYQTVAISGATADMEALLVKALADDATPVTQEAYNKAYGIISDGKAWIDDGNATFKVYKKPVINIKVGLKGE